MWVYYWLWIIMFIIAYEFVYISSFPFYLKDEIILFRKKEFCNFLTWAKVFMIQWDIRSSDEYRRKTYSTPKSNVTQRNYLCPYFLSSLRSGLHSTQQIHGKSYLSLTENTFKRYRENKKHKMTLAQHVRLHEPLHVHSIPHITL